jgi:hypothetical protein
MALPVFFKEYAKNVQAISEALQLLVKDVFPEAEEIFNPGWKNISYGNGKSRADKDLIVYIAPFKDSVNLGFYRGVNLPDPEQLLKGTGKQMRHVKLKTKQQLTSDAILNLLLAAKNESQINNTSN